LICFFEGKEDFKPKIKVLGANRNLLAFPKDYHFTIDTQNTFPQFWNCFFGIRNGGFSDEFHEFEKVLNPEMTNAYLPKASLLAVWVRVLAEV
jgi:diphosphomevalonate decarboxylase